MEKIFLSFSGREMAAMISTLLFLLWALSIKGFRIALIPLIKTFFSRQILIPILAMCIYIVAMVLFFYNIGFWNISNLKDTLFWGLGTAFVMLMNVSDARNENYFKKIIIDNLKLILIVEFIVSSYTFNFWIELIVVIPFLTLLVLLKVVAEKDQKYLQVNRVLDFLIGFSGFALICYSFSEMLVNLIDFISLNNFIGFLLPPVFTFLFLPFMYFAGLYVSYEHVFIRLNVFRNDKKLISYAKWKIFLKFKLNLKRLNKWSSRVGIMKFNTKQDIHDLLNR